MNQARPIERSINRQSGRTERRLPPGAGAALARPGPLSVGMHLYNYGFTSLFLVFFPLD